MNYLIPTAAIVAVVSSVSIAQDAAQPGAKQAEVPVKAVVLFSSGVGYFEHFGNVQGDGSTELRFKTEQINDILKSLVLQDLDGGKVNVITYPSQDPIAKTLASFQVNLSGNPPLAELLNQLRGARVSITAQGDRLEGTILGVETKRRPAGEKGEPIEVRVLNVLNGATIRSIALDDVRTIELEDPQLQEELAKALAALAQSRDQDKKPVQIGFTGQGDRRVRLGYVVETPVWKTSYRLLMSDDPNAKDGIQGWAIVENQTDNDWKDVQLSLVSGRPISFVQDLYQPLYIPRPVVMPELYASLRPQQYEAGMEEAKEADRFGQAEVQMKARRGQAPAAAAPAPAPDFDNAPDFSMLKATESVASVASAAKVGELFQYTVGNVSLPRQKSAMIPIITDPVELEKLSIYNQAVLPKNPLTGARLKNTTDKHLLAGPITVYEAGTYAGDAQIDNVPPGQERLLSYGIDLQMLVDATKNTTNSAIQTGRIVKGVLYITRKHVATQDYTAENKSDHQKTLVIEHPIKPGWKLVNTEMPVETTDTLYRFKGAVAPGKSSKLTVTEEIVQDETIAILPADFGQIQFYARQGEIPQAVRDALGKAMQLKQSMTEAQRLVNDRTQQMAQITQEQNRIRENMKTVNQNSEYYNRLLKKLNEQESQIEKLQNDRDQLQQAFEEHRRELEQYLSNLNVG